VGQCNFCLLRQIKAQAKKQRCKVVLRRSSFLGGTEIYVIPKDMKMPKKIIEPCKEYPNGGPFHEKYSRAWVMEIGDSCCC